MKKIKLLLPLWLVLLYFGSIVFMLQNRQENNSAYQQMVDRARAYAENDIIVDAMASYEEALEIQPNIDLAVEAGRVYLENEAYQDAGSWYRERIHDVYPDQLETYDFGIRLYLAQENYRQAFSLYDEYQERKLFSEHIEELMAPVLYTFDLSGEFEECRPFGNLSGIAPVCYQGCWGYIDTTGDRILDYVYASAGIFGDMGAVVDQEGDAYFIDSAGNKRITGKSILEKDPDFGRVEEFLGIESGMLWAYNGTIWNCYNAETYAKLFGGYKEVTNFTNGIGAVKDESGKWALLSSDGEQITEFLYDQVLADQKLAVCRTEAVLVKEGKNCLLLNKEGKQVGDQTYEDACAFFDGTYAAVKIGGEWRFIDGTGEEQELGSYEQAQSFSGGLAAVCRDGKWGYIDQQGELVIDYQFSETGPFSSSGIAFVKPEGETHWKLLTLYKDNHE